MTARTASASLFAGLASATLALPPDARAIALALPVTDRFGP